MISEVQQTAQAKPEADFPDAASVQPTKPERKHRMAREPAQTDAVAPSTEPPAAPTSKVSLVIALLGRTEGATLAEMTGATGWQSHSARAVLTGLRKKGHAITKAKRGDVTSWHIADAS